MKAGIVEQQSWVGQCRSSNRLRRQDGSLVWVCDSWWRRRRRGYWVARWVSLAWAWAAASWCGRWRRHGVTTWWVSHLLCLALASPFLFIFLFFSFIFGFSVWFWGLTDCWFFFTYIYIYIYFFKVVMGFENSWAGLAGIEMAEVRGAQAKNQEGAWAKNQGDPSLFFWKFYILNFFFFGPRGARAPFCLLPGSVPNFIMQYARDRRLALTSTIEKKKKFVLTFVLSSNCSNLFLESQRLWVIFFFFRVIIFHSFQFKVYRFSHFFNTK